MFPILYFRTGLMNYRKNLFFRRKENWVWLFLISLVIAFVAAQSIFSALSLNFYQSIDYSCTVADDCMQKTTYPLCGQNCPKCVNKNAVTESKYITIAKAINKINPLSQESCTSKMCWDYYPVCTCINNKCSYDWSS